MHKASQTSLVIPGSPLGHGSPLGPGSPGSPFSPIIMASNICNAM